MEDLADYNFAIQYTPGKENAAADCLSRLYDPEHVHPSPSAVLQDGYLPEGVYLHGIVPGGVTLSLKAYMLWLTGVNQLHA